MGAPPPAPDPFWEHLPWRIDDPDHPTEDPDDEPLDLLLPADTPLSDQIALDDLISQGFSWEEALRLLVQRANLYDSPEMRERMLADPHLGFARWLYQRGRLQS